MVGGEVGASVVRDSASGLRAEEVVVVLGQFPVPVGGGESLFLLGPVPVPRDDGVVQVGLVGGGGSRLADDVMVSRVPGRRRRHVMLPPVVVALPLPPVGGLPRVRGLRAVVIAGLVGCRRMLMVRVQVVRLRRRGLLVLVVLMGEGRSELLVMVQLLFPLAMLLVVVEQRRRRRVG